MNHSLYLDGILKPSPFKRLPCEPGLGSTFHFTLAKQVVDAVAA
jgi:hypothetical protein